MTNSVELQERLASLRERRAILGHQERRLSEDIREALTKGTDDTVLSTERRQVRDTIADLEEAIPQLAAQVEEEKRQALVTDAEAEILSLRKSIGGTYGEHGSDLERATKLLVELEPIYARVVGARSRQLRLRVLIEALSTRFSLPIPDLKMLPTEQGDGALGAVVGRIQNLLNVGGIPLSPRAKNGTPLQRAKDVLPSLVSWGVETRALDLLEQAGPSADEMEKERALERARREREIEAERVLGPVQSDIAAAQATPSPGSFRA